MGYIETISSLVWIKIPLSLITIWDILKQKNSLLAFCDISFNNNMGYIETNMDYIEPGSFARLITIWDILKQTIDRKIGVFQPV